MRYTFPRTRMDVFMRGVGKSAFAVIRSEARDLLFAEDPGLQRLAERFLRFVMLVAVVLVKTVCPLANYIGTDRHTFTAVFARPIFGGGQQPRARPEAALPFRHNEPVHFRAHLHLQEWLLAPLYPTDNAFVRSIC